MLVPFRGAPTWRMQGWRSGGSARLPPLWPGFDSRTRCHMWVEFVVGSRPCSKFQFDLVMRASGLSALLLVLLSLNKVNKGKSNMP